MESRTHLLDTPNCKSYLVSIELRVDDEQYLKLYPPCLYCALEVSHLSIARRKIRPQSSLGLRPSIVKRQPFVTVTTSVIVTSQSPMKKYPTPEPPVGSELEERSFHKGHPDLQIRPGGPGFQVIIGKWVGLDGLGFVKEYGYGGGVMVLVTGGCVTAGLVRGLGSSVMANGGDRILLVG
ncbi:hypothetical protein HD806DRAFT_551942 [Xylariaceae sp. AK1471]|nr:hypothetical protein HD806DRAFT_551942 [Xylariaceae sp. AK1471]